MAAHFQAGLQALQSGQYVRAIDEYKAVLLLDPARVEAHVNLGLAYHSLREYELAVAEFDKALRENPSIPGASLFAGIDYLKLGLSATAIAPLEAALRVQPSNREAKRVLAACYLDQDEYRNAAEQFRSLSSLESDQAEALYVLGRSYLDLVQHLADRLSQRHQNTAWANRLAGDLVGESLRLADATKLYRRALALDPSQPEVHASLGKIYLVLGKLEAAEEQFQSALKLDPQNEQALLGLAEIHLVNGVPRAALVNIERIWQIYPPFLRHQPGFPSMKLRPEWLHKLATDLEGVEDTPAKRFLIFSLSSVAGEEEKVRTQVARVEHDFATWQEKHKRRAEALADPCGWHEYSACVDRLKSAKEQTVSSSLILGKALFSLRNDSAAADTFAEVLSKDQHNVAAMYWLARAYKQLADRLATRLIEQFPDSARAHQFRAESSLLRESYDDAINEYQASIRLRSSDPEMLEELSEVYLHKKLFTEADRELKKAIELDPTRARSLYLLGRSRLSQHRDRESVPYLQQALRMQPGLLEAHAALGQAYMRLKQPIRAVPELERAAAIDSHGNLYYLLYVAYRNLGKNDLARKALARSRELRKGLVAEHQASTTEIFEDEIH